MSSVSQTGEGCFGEVGSSVKEMVKSIAGFFRRKEITRCARIYHGDFSYPLTPDTAISSFNNMKRVTSIDSGDCYVCIFDESNYQGNYHIIGPGEKAQINGCGSLVIGLERFSVNSIKDSAHAPRGYWEMDGPMYILYFSPAYRYC